MHMRGTIIVLRLSGTAVAAVLAICAVSAPAAAEGIFANFFGELR
jgi:hypothetical protein